MSALADGSGSGSGSGGGGQQRRVVVNCWCGPRTLSTALLYSFDQRPDSKCYDEPLYASWLSKNPAKYRPYREEFLASAETDGNAVMRRLGKLSDGEGGGVVFCKHIARQVQGVERELILGQRCDEGVTVRHVFLFRDPLEQIECWGAVNHVHQEGATLESMCFPQLVQLYSEACDLALDTGAPMPICIDSGLLKAFPEETLRELCRLLEIPFFPKEQLNWPAGPKAVDGMWAKYWYDSVHKSTGFSQTTLSTRAYSTNEPLTPRQIELYRQTLPFYDLLRRSAIGTDSLQPRSTCTHPSFTLSTDAKAGVRRTMPLPDSRNENTLIWVGDRLVPRDLARISVFDSAVQGGDAVWEGLRVYNGRVFKLTEHLDRLVDSARALAFKNIPTREFVQEAVFKTLSANGMSDGCHMRLTLTRGCKITSSMNPVFNVFGTNLLIVPEWKPVCGAATYDNSCGVSLITATNRRNPPQCLDSKIHHCNLLNNILPKIQANLASAADAIMLDVDGFLSETNATNIFICKSGIVATPDASSCLPGITRATVMRLCRDVLGILCEERRISLSEAHCADECFTTGTMGELTPVVSIDGRQVGDGKPGKILAAISEAYKALTQTEGTPVHHHSS